MSASQQMNWLIFGLFTYAALALQGGLRTLLALPEPATGVSPQFTLILLVYVGLMAPPRSVAWASLALGVLVDVQSAVVPGGPIIGPATLGYLLGGYAAVQLRTLVFRQSILTVGVTTFAVGVLVQLVIVALLTMRGLPWLTAEPIDGWSTAYQLERRFLMLLYTAIAAAPVGALLLRSTPIWNFPNKTRGRDF